MARIVIIGVDHVGWSLPDAAAAAAVLTDLGYSLVFREPFLATSLTKAALLRRFADTHAIEYWRHPAAPAVETIVHAGTISAPVAPFPTVVVAGSAQGTSSDLPEPLRAGLSALGLAGERVTLAPTRTPAIRAGDPGRGILAYVIATPEVEKAARIWRDGLGATMRIVGGDLALARVEGPLPQWRLDVVIVRDRSSALGGYLDDEGFRNVGLLTTDLQRDRARLEAAGIEMTEPFEMAVDRRTLRVSMGRGAGAEIVELIAIA